MSFALLLVLAQLQSDSALPPPVMRVMLKVGEQRASPVPRGIGVMCDDRNVVEIVEVADHVELKGLAPGKTLCGFGRGQMPNAVVEVVVSK